MVRAILDGTKTQTRRMAGKRTLVNPGISADTVAIRHAFADRWEEMFVPGRVDGRNPDNAPLMSKAQTIKCPYCVGDRLWVKETWALHPDEHPDEAGILYRATDPGWDDSESGLRWKPSIFMRREYSRISLEITGVRVERLQDISEEDAIAEGVERGIYCGVDDEGPALRSIDCEADEQLASYRDGFRFVWECINGQGSWESNPWVWVVQFKRIKP